MASWLDGGPRTPGGDRPARRRRMSSFVLRDVMALDEGGGFDGPTDVAVEDGVIVAVGPNTGSTDGPDYDFSGLWLLPGMFDCHLHAVATSLDTMELLRTPISERILEAASILRRTLEAGVTFVRDAGGADAGIRWTMAARPSAVEPANDPARRPGQSGWY